MSWRTPSRSWRSFVMPRSRTIRTVARCGAPPLHGRPRRRPRDASWPTRSGRPRASVRRPRPRGRGERRSNPSWPRRRPGLCWPPRPSGRAQSFARPRAVARLPARPTGPRPTNAPSRAPRRLPRFGPGPTALQPGSPRRRRGGSRVLRVGSAAGAWTRISRSTRRCVPRLRPRWPRRREPTSWRPTRSRGCPGSAGRWSSRSEPRTHRSTMRANAGSGRPWPRPAAGRSTAPCATTRRALPAGSSRGPPGCRTWRAVSRSRPTSRQAGSRSRATGRPS